MLLVKWRLFDNCNFKCSYCINNVYSKTNQKINIDRLKKFAECIHNLIEKENDEVLLGLIGGEITLIPFEDLKEIITILYTKNIKKIHITSNTSAKTDYYISIQKLCNSLDIDLKLVCSFHEEMMNYDIYINKAKILSKEIKNFLCEFVVTHNNLSLFKKLKKECNNNNINLLSDYNRKEFWNKDEVEFSDKKDIARAIINPKGCVCSNSIYTINIKPNGEVYGVVCKSRKLMGLINMMSSFKKETLICNQTKCSFCGKIEVKTTDGKLIFSNLNGKVLDL